MSLIEKRFPEYARNKKSELSEGEYRVFVKTSDSLMQLVRMLVLACVLLLLARAFPDKSARLIGKIYGLGLCLSFYIYELTAKFIKLYGYVRKDLKEKRYLIAATLLTLLLCAGTFILCVNDFAEIVRKDGAAIKNTFNKKAQTFVCDEIGMKVEVPPGYSDITYESVGDENSVRWYVENETNVIWVYVYMDWSFVSCYTDSEGNICDIMDVHFDRFHSIDKAYFQGGFLAYPEMVEMDSRPAYMAYGMRDTDSDDRYVIYRFLRNNALICVTYAFASSLDQEEEMKEAYGFVSDMEFK